MSNKSTAHINQAMNETVAQAEIVPSPAEVSRMMGLENNVAYIAADSFTGNPYALLGSVIEVRKSGGQCPATLNANGVVPEFSPRVIPDIRVDEKSKIREPIKRQSIIVDQRLAMKVGILNYLSAELGTESSFSLLVFDQAIGLADRKHVSWGEGLTQWEKENEALFADEDICYLFAVIGFTQKYIIRRKYQKYTAGVRGGAFGVNLNGELYTSTEDYSLDIRYGLQPSILKRPTDKVRASARAFGWDSEVKAPSAHYGRIDSEPTSEESQLFATISDVRLR
jgi:hypothetical protein